MTRTQAFRHMALAGPGDEVLLLRSMSGTEELGKSFEYTLECVSESADVVFEDWLGQNVTIRLTTHGGERDRFLNGIICQMEQTGMIGRLATYRLTFVPFLWLLSRKADCRIYQDMSVPEIVQELLKEKGFTDIDDRLSRDYKKREYTVQYRETDLNFISRLMESEGIYFYFIHEDGKHTFVMADDRGGHEAEPGSEEIPFFPPGAKTVSRPHIYQWRVMKQIQSTAYSTTDYNFQKPKDDLYVRSSKPKQHTFGEIEIFDYPGEYMEYADGETAARIRAEELEVGYETIDAQASSRFICAGRVFTLTGHPRADQGREYLIVGTTIEASTDAYDGGKIDQDGSFTFRCGFDCIPAETPYRRAATTPKPVIPGPQTAFVTGVEGAEITTDEFGRVKVKFHWDLYNEANEKSSCWLRVSQEFAGKKWGSMYVPRRGQEVIVTFLEGDPDKPLITGRVYNAENRPAYDPKANPTLSGLKTCTIDGEGFNEIRFDDKAGAEQIFIHAQKDMDIRVKDTVRKTVEKEYHFTVESNYYYKTGGDHHIEVGGSYFETILGDRHIIADGSEMKEISGNKDLTVKGDLTESITGNQTTTVSGDCWYLAPDWHVEADSNIDLFSHGDAHVVGDSKVKLKSAGSTIEVTPGGIKITTPGTFEVTAGGGIKLTAPSIDLTSAMTKATGVVQAATVIAQIGVVSPSYTPGAGNTL